MERQSMFADRKAQYCQDVSSSQLGLQNKCNPNQNSSNLFLVINKVVLKCIWRGKRHRIANTTLKENNAEELTLHEFKTYYKTTIFKAV